MTSTESHSLQSQGRNSAVPGEVRLSESNEFHKKSPLVLIAMTRKHQRRALRVQRPHALDERRPLGLIDRLPLGNGFERLLDGG